MPERYRILHGGALRSVLAIADDPEPGAAILVVLHGSAQTGETIRRMAPGFDAAARGGGAVVLYPDGISHHWNDARVGIAFATRHRATDDVGFVLALAADAERRFGADPSRLVVAGFSNGGSMVIRLALEVPELLAAAATIGATVPAPDNLVPGVSHPGSVPMILFLGDADPIVPFGGGIASIHGERPRGAHLGGEESAAFWAARNGMTGSPEVVERPDLADDATSAVVESWRETGRDPVEFWRIRGGGHTVPGGRHPGPRWGAMARRTDAAAEILRFAGLTPPPAPLPRPLPPPPE